MRAKQKFIIVLTPDEEQPEILNVTVPALPGCFTWGHGRNQAIRNAKEVIAGFLESIYETEIAANAESAEVEVFA